MKGALFTFCACIGWPWRRLNHSPKPVWRQGNSKSTGKCPRAGLDRRFGKSEMKNKPQIKKVRSCMRFQGAARDSKRKSGFDFQRGGTSPPSSTLARQSLRLDIDVIMHSWWPRTLWVGSRPSTSTTCKAWTDKVRVRIQNPGHLKRYAGRHHAQCASPTSNALGSRMS